MLKYYIILCLRQYIYDCYFEINFQGRVVKPVIACLDHWIRVE